MEKNGTKKCRNLDSGFRSEASEMSNSRRSVSEGGGAHLYNIYLNSGQQEKNANTDNPCWRFL
jgi:hypothetical protein